jgi:small-conductance mechanosensitive channel
MVLETASRVSEQAKTEALEDEPATAPAEASVERKASPGAALSSELLPKLSKVIPPLWLVATVVVGVVAGIQVAFLVLAAGVLTFVISLMWASVQSLTGGSSLGFEEALGMGAPSKVEEEKRAVLRALKDLEYERGVGKISAEDYAELSAKYRAEAKRLIQSVDEALGPARSEVEKAIEKRLERAGMSPLPAEAPVPTQRAVVDEARPSAARAVSSDEAEQEESEA